MDLMHRVDTWRPVRVDEWASDKPFDVAEDPVMMDSVSVMSTSEVKLMVMDLPGAPPVTPFVRQFLTMTMRNFHDHRMYRPRSLSLTDLSFFLPSFSSRSSRVAVPIDFRRFDHPI